MSDVLSQEEIDRLLGAAAADLPPELPGLGGPALGASEKLARLIFASANTALAALLARTVTVSDGLGQVVDVGAVEPARTLVVRCPFRSGFTGELAFVLRHPDASALADLILGGDGTPKATLDDADLDALQEAFSQVTGSASPALTATLGRDVAFSSPRAETVESGRLGASLPWGHAFLSQSRVKVDTGLEAPLRLLLSLELAGELGHVWREQESSAPRPGPKPVSPAKPPAGTQAAAPTPAAEIHNINLILDIEVEVIVRLGQAVLPLRDIQRLRPGAIIDLDKETEAPVELVVNDRVIATGELVVVSSDHFALRISDIETPTERIRRLGP